MIRAAICTAMPCTSPSSISTSPVCKPAANVQTQIRDRVSNCARAGDRTRRAIKRRQCAIAGELDLPCHAHRSPLAGPPGYARQGSSFHAWSPKAVARSVDPTISVNSTVDSTRLLGLDRRAPANRSRSIGRTRRAGEGGRPRCGHPKSVRSENSVWARTADRDRGYRRPGTRG